MSEVGGTYDAFELLTPGSNVCGGNEIYSHDFLQELIEIFY